MAASTIDEEMRLMNAAQDALRTGHSKRALSLLNEHSERFPNGKLSSARSVTRMMALCQAGSSEQARREAEQFLARHPSSPFVDRVKTICR
jgi:outer membrane protein assembly factor BamD (BamD/ComL family)